MRAFRHCMWFGVTALLLWGCNRADDKMNLLDLQIRPEVGALLAKYAPVEISAGVSFLPENEQQALANLIAASKYMDEIFLRQVWERNPEMRHALMQRTDALGRQALEFFKLNYGPWDRLDERPFIGAQEKPKGAGYYPADMTREEFEQHLAADPQQAEALKGLFTVVRRDQGRLVAVPYAESYEEWLAPAAKLLLEAAALTNNASLQNYLRLRAEAFRTNDYRASDMAWMDLDSPVEITIGPYETYEDKLFGYKAAFESFVTVADPGESEKLARFKAELPAMEENLPIPDHMKNRARGTASPIRVVDVVMTAGDTRAGVQTIAFNLPNDEVVREQKGSKKVLLRNVIAAKYEKILRPIASRLLPAEQLALLSAEAFTNEVLFHELSHGLGPGRITRNGRATEVRLELRELYSASEEAKADIMGVYNIYFMIEKGLLPASMHDEIAVTYLAGLLRGIRFGISEAHGKGNALQFNYLMAKGALHHDAAGGTYAVNFDSFRPALRELLRELCVLQATGDYAGTLKLFTDYAHLPPSLATALQQLHDVPVDIAPKYTAVAE